MENWTENARALAIGDAPSVFAIAILVVGYLVEITEHLELELDKNGVSIPYPQRDVHLHQAA